MSDEVWKSILDYEGYYEVSSLGRVRSVDRVVFSRTKNGGYQRRLNGRMLVLVNHGGYRIVSLTREGSRIDRGVHTLVAEAFYGPGGRRVARHLNDIRDDNRVENLAWGSPSDNQLDSVRNGKHPESRRTHCDNGHEYTFENTSYRARRGGVSRVCGICAKIWGSAARKRYRQKLKSKKLDTNQEVLFRMGVESGEIS